MEEEKFQKIIEHLEKEIANIRTGRAMPNLIENINVEVYGAKTPLSQLASISAPEPQLLTVQPWDQNNLKEIERAIRASNLDLNPVVNEKIIRINFPPLTEEKRKELVKIVNQKSEEAKISVKNNREENIKKFKQQEKDKEISEDEKFRLEKELQEIVDKYQTKIKELMEKKEKELMKI